MKLSGKSPLVVLGTWFDILYILHILALKLSLLVPEGQSKRLYTNYVAPKTIFDSWGRRRHSFPKTWLQVRVFDLQGVVGSNYELIFVKSHSLKQCLAVEENLSSFFPTLTYLPAEDWAKPSIIVHCLRTNLQTLNYAEETHAGIGLTSNHRGLCDVHRRTRKILEVWNLEYGLY